MFLGLTAEDWLEMIIVFTCIIGAFFTWWFCFGREAAWHERGWHYPSEDKKEDDNEPLV